MPDLNHFSLSDTTIQSLSPSHVSSRRSSNNEKGSLLHILADLPIMRHFRSLFPGSDRIEASLLPLRSSLLAGISGLLFLQGEVTLTFMWILSHLRIFQASGDQTHAREAFENALTLARITGFHVLPEVSAIIEMDEIHPLVILGYLGDFPQDMTSALQAVAEFGTSAISVLFYLHGWKILKDLHCHALATLHLPLPYSKFLFHMVAVVITASSGDGEEAVFAAMFRSVGPVHMVISKLINFASCGDIREYYYRCMVLHYVYYMRFKGSNHVSDLHQSLGYRLSADAIFPGPLELTYRPLDFKFIAEVVQQFGPCVLTQFLPLSRYNPDISSGPETQTNLDVTYQAAPLVGPHGKFQPTIESAKLTLAAWLRDGYNRKHLQMATKYFSEVASFESTTKADRQAAQWWLAFIRSNPDPHAMNGYYWLLDFETNDSSWARSAADCVCRQMYHAYRELDPLRLTQLLPLTKATLAILDERSKEFRDLKEHEARLIDIMQVLHGHSPEMQKVVCQLVSSRFGDTYKTPLADLKVKAMSSKESSFLRLRHARDWAQRSLEKGLPESLDAFQLFASLLQENIPLDSVAEHKHRILSSETWLQHWGDSAVTAVVRHGGPDRLSLAVEFLEQSRSVTYRHLFQLRQENVQLAEAYPELGKTWVRFTTYIHKTFQTMAEPSNRRSDDSDGMPPFRSLQEYRGLLEEIREKPGFENFLRPQKYGALSRAAAEGPVIMISSDPQTEMSHALILLLGREQPIYLQLPEEARYSKVLGYSNTLTHLLARDKHLTRRGWKLDIKPSDYDSLRFQRIIEWLWDCVVSPIFDTLKDKAAYTSGRVWWCPSGSFTSLPLHAAAMLDPYRSIVSSYTPSLELLIDSRRRGPASDDTMMPRRLAAVGLRSCPRRKELQPLYAVKKELELFSAKDGMPFKTVEITKLEDNDAQVRSVLNTMKSSHIVHLACHGVQDSSDPLNSHLILHDDELSLRALMNENLPFAEFAFLSACQTAAGHKQLANESVHLTGGFITAGFNGVVGTLWSIADQDAPRVVQKVYESMVTEEGGFDIRKAAEGLHSVVHGMIKQGLPPRRWAPFIHVGI